MFKNKKPTKPDGLAPKTMSRIYWVFLLIAIFGVAIIGRAIYIQLFLGAELREEAMEKELKFFDSDAVRGNIYSADGALLVTSAPIYEIRMDAASNLIPDDFFNANVTYLAGSLSKMFKDKTQSEYEKMIKNAREKGNQYLLIQKNVNYQQLKQIKKFPIFIRGKYCGGLIANMTTKREFPCGILAKRTLGYVKQKTIKDSGIYVGIEGKYNDYLKGKKGKQLKQKMSNGAWRPIQNENNIEPENGKDIITTIDIYLQDVAESALLKHLIINKAEKGTVILMEVKTGEIKAIANLQLDHNDGKYKELYNIAVGESFEPGSTFKLVSVLVAAEEGMLYKVDSVEIGPGWIVYHNRTMKDTHLIDPDGWILPIEAFQHSSNVGISKIIFDYFNENPWAFIKGIQKLQLDKSLGINIIGEPRPFINSPNSPTWSKVSLPWMSIGYEVRLTSLQMLVFYNAIANNGTMVRPKFVKEIRDAGKVIKRFDTEIIAESICSDKTIKLAHKYLESVVDSGTAKIIKNPIYKIAGKTGTAQIAKPGGGYLKKYNASFVGYFPADNPMYSCVVLINKPDGGSYYATKVAAPVFKEVADKVYATRYDFRPENTPDAQSLQAFK